MRLCLTRLRPAMHAAHIHVQQTQGRDRREGQRTSHTLHSLHSYARDMQRVPRSQTRIRVAIPRVTIIHIHTNTLVFSLVFMLVCRDEGAQVWAREIPERSGMRADTTRVVPSAIGRDQSRSVRRVRKGPRNGNSLGMSKPGEKARRALRRCLSSAL